MAKRGRKPKVPTVKARISSLEICMLSCARCGMRPRIEFDPVTDKLEAACPECGERIRYHGYMLDSAVYEIWNREQRSFKRKGAKWR